MAPEKEKELLLTLLCSLNTGNTGCYDERVKYARTQLRQLKEAYDSIDERAVSE